MKDATHLLRLAGLFAFGIVLFLLVRQQVMPAGFGKYGHYRPAALEAVRNRPMTYAGRNTCGGCHDDQLKVLHAGKHAGVGCEACHGAQSKHAEDSGSIKPVLPRSNELCPVCHEANSAKPKIFPQVVSADHSGGEECKTCHLPHRPKPTK